MKIFNATNENSHLNEKNFQYLELRTENQTELILDNDLFSDLTFQYFNSKGI